ncbi:MAG: nitroreductase family protein [Pseudomonadota bacterium]
MELFEAMRTTFAARDYTGDALPDEVLYRILDNARFAPSGGNRQGAHVIVVRDPGTRAEIAALSREPAQRYMAQRDAGESPWNTIDPSEVDAATIAAQKAPGMLTRPFETASVVLVITVNLKLVASTDALLDRVGVVSGGSIYPLAWNILLAARAEGYGGTITTLAIANEPQLQALLHLPTHYAVAALMPLGKPVKQLTKLSRNAVREFVTREHFDGDAFDPS